MQLGAEKRRKNKILIAPITLLLTASLVAGLLFYDSKKVEANPTLPGIETLIMNNSNTDPFVIYEVVSSKDKANLGYLVGGEEPIDSEGRGLNDMPSKEERTEKMEAFANSGTIPNDLDGNALTFTSDYKEVIQDGESWKETPEGAALDITSQQVSEKKIHGKFVEKTSGNYKKTSDTNLYTATDSNTDIEQINENEEYLYRKIITYNLSNIQADIEFQIKKMDSDEIPVEIDGNYNYQYFTADKITDVTPSDDAWVFTGTSDTLQYLDKYENVKNDISEGQITVNDVLSDVYIVHESQGSDIGKDQYCIKSVTGTYTPRLRSIRRNVPSVTVSPSASPEGLLSPSVTPDISDTPTGENTDDESVVATPSATVEQEETLTPSNQVTPTPTSEEEPQEEVIEEEPTQESPTPGNTPDGDGIVKETRMVTLPTLMAGPGDEFAVVSYRIVNKNETGIYAIVETPEEASDEEGNILEDDLFNGKYYVKTGDREYEYKSDLSGDYIFQADQTLPEVDSFYYIKGFQNEEWFKQYVFDLSTKEEQDNMILDVVPVTVDELSADMLENADMIYFAGADTSDIELEAAKAILGSVQANGFPVVIDKSVYDNADDTNNPYLKLLLMALLQENLATADVATCFEDVTTSLTALEPTMKEPLTYTDSGIEEFSYVNQSIFVNDNTYGEAGTGVGPIADKNFPDKVTLQEKIDYGFSDVIAEIKSENFYLELSGKSERIGEVVSKATAIRYILNYGNKRSVSKTQLSILDLEPYDFESYYQSGSRIYEDIGKSHDRVNTITSDSIYLHKGKISKDWIVANLAPNLEDKDDAIKVDVMGTKEFIGKQNDLNADYDLIYLGMDTSIMNTSIRNGNKTNDTRYNDSNMNGLVYAHMGDSLNVQEATDIPNANFRMSGNDITPDKKRALQEYVEAGYAMLVSDDFFNEDLTINKSKVDESSNMYRFIKDVLLKKEDGKYVYLYKNVNIKSNLEGSDTATAEVRSTFSDYLNISKLVLSYEEDDIPLPYNKEDGTQQYLTMNEDGKYVMDFEMTLKNDSAVTVSATDYDVNLYLDMDADGKFEEEEKLSGLSVRNVDQSSDCGMSDGKYHLLAGYTYHISRQVPDGFVGFLSWKLVFAQNDRTFSDTGKNSIVRKAVTGFSAVPCPINVPTIKVLQITSGNNANNENNNLDLNETEMKSLYSEVKDFHIQVEQITSQDYVNKTTFKDRDYYDYLCDYNMLVLGFKDIYYFGTTTGSNDACKNAILGIRQYAVSGRSVLFTHDLNSFVLNENSSRSNWGYYANMYLRDIQGMDRYGKVKQSGLIPQGLDYEYESKYDTALLKDDSKENTGFTDPLIIWNNVQSNNSYGVNARAASYYYAYHKYYSRRAGSEISHGRFSNAMVQQVNAGQITEYPFKITDFNADTFKVSHTHPQYFQLNLDTDSYDELTNDDIVVWYTISDVVNSDGSSAGDDSFYKALPKDVRNNYYIYNKGNVTYTGCGDSKVTDRKEKELFVNTLVAAYNAGIHAPTVIYKESQLDSSADIISLCIPYDPMITTPEGEESLNSQLVKVNFKTINNNLRHNNKPLYAKYYMETPTGSTVIGTHHLVELTPTTFKQVVNDGTTLSTVDATPSVLNNFTIYTMQFRRAQLGLNSTIGVSSDNSVNIYVRLSTKPFEEMTSGNVLSANESLNRLNILYTELVDLE